MTRRRNSYGYFSNYPLHPYILWNGTWPCLYIAGSHGFAIIPEANRCYGSVSGISWYIDKRRLFTFRSIEILDPCLGREIHWAHLWDTPGSWTCTLIHDRREGGLARNFAGRETWLIFSFIILTSDS